LNADLQDVKSEKQDIVFAIDKRKERLNSDDSEDYGPEEDKTGEDVDYPSDNEEEEEVDETQKEEILKKLIAGVKEAYEKGKEQ